MQLVAATCPACSARVVVERSLHRIGTVRLRCAGCAHYFVPDDSPADLSLEEAANASVPITLYEPNDAS